MSAELPVHQEIESLVTDDTGVQFYGLNGLRWKMNSRMAEHYVPVEEIRTHVAGGKRYATYYRYGKKTTNETRPATPTEVTAMAIVAMRDMPGSRSAKEAVRFAGEVLHEQLEETNQLLGYLAAAQEVAREKVLG